MSERPTCPQCGGYQDEPLKLPGGPKPKMKPGGRDGLAVSLPVPAILVWRKCEHSFHSTPTEQPEGFTRDDLKRDTLRRSPEQPPDTEKPSYEELEGDYAQLRKMYADLRKAKFDPERAKMAEAFKAEADRLRAELEAVTIARNAAEQHERELVARAERYREALREISERWCDLNDDGTGPTCLEVECPGDPPCPVCIASAALADEGDK